MKKGENEINDTDEKCYYQNINEEMNDKNTMAQYAPMPPKPRTVTNPSVPEMLEEAEGEKPKGLSFLTKGKY